MVASGQCIDAQMHCVATDEQETVPAKIKEEELKALWVRASELDGNRMIPSACAEADDFPATQKDDEEVEGVEKDVNSDHEVNNFKEAFRAEQGAIS